MHGLQCGAYRQVRRSVARPHRILTICSMVRRDFVLDEARSAAIFERLTGEDGRDGHAPFRWQMRLLRRFMDADLPAAVDVPTGLGKTSVMALWLIALGEGARLPAGWSMSSIRRAVVDQATRFAERLRAMRRRRLART